MSQASVGRTLLAAAMIAALSARAIAQTGASHWVSIGPQGGTVLTLAGLTVGGATPGQTVHPWGSSPCPPATDTLSLLQPGDSAYTDAPAVSLFLKAHHFTVRCVTRTKFEGFFGVRRAAAFQTDQGPITVLFFEGADRARVQQEKTAKGYRYWLQNPPHPGIGAAENVNGPLYFMARGRWFIIAPDGKVAATLARAVAEP
jgi:hypothetical protein